LFQEQAESESKYNKLEAGSFLRRRRTRRKKMKIKKKKISADASALLTFSMW
jgi:hypothetical protein